MSEEKLLLCIKWGDMYGPDYVNILYGMIGRNLNSPFRLVCFTDDTNGIRAEVECLPLPPLGVEIPKGAPGKWPKQALWADNLYGLQGVALFLDLDSVIVDSLEPYFEYGHPDDVITARNWVKPWLRMSQTSVFRYKIGTHGYMLDNLRKNPQLMMKYRFEQKYVSSCIKGGVRFFPPAWTKHFGIHCTGLGPMRYFMTPRLPKGARIITFPGDPKPPDAMAGRWNEAFSTCPPKQHLQWVLKQRSVNPHWRKYLYRYIKPTPWVAENWRE